jgi:hypothetical protein
VQMAPGCSIETKNSPTARSCRAMITDPITSVAIDIDKVASKFLTSLAADDMKRVEASWPNFERSDCQCSDHDCSLTVKARWPGPRRTTPHQAGHNRKQPLGAPTAGRLNSNPDEPEPPFSKRLINLKLPDDGQEAP